MGFKMLFLLFIMYAILGWAIEVMDCYILNKKWVNRGFLIGPYCPIYGCGAVLMSLLVSNEHDVIFKVYGYLLNTRVFNKLYNGKIISYKMVGLY